MTVSSNYSSYASYGSSTASAQQMPKPNFEEIAQSMLDNMDSDGDGSVSSTEFSTASSGDASSSDIFSLLDTDSSGNMSTEELVAALKNMRPPEPPQGEMGSMPPPPSDSSSSENDLSKIFSALDTDQDGSISQDELSVLFGTASNSESTTASASQTAEKIKQQASNDLLQKILSHYGSESSNTTSSSLDLSA